MNFTDISFFLTEREGADICSLRLDHHGEFFSRGSTHIYTEQNYKRNTFVVAPIFHELNSKI